MQVAKRECEYGDHGNRYTWCTHPEIAKGRDSVARSVSYCNQCPLFEVRTGSHARRNHVSISSCIHLGDVAGNVMCKTCGGNKVAASVHNCGLGGVCVVKMRHWEWAKEFDAENGIRVKRKCCETCSERKQPELNEQE